MSGVGKTTLARTLLQAFGWYQLFCRLPHRHPLHGRAHRRQFQARGDARSRSCVTCCCTDSIYISSPTSSFDQPRSRCRPISASPATRAKGGISFRRIQEAARRSTAQAEISARCSTCPLFIEQGARHLSATRTSSATPAVRSARSSILSEPRSDPGALLPRGEHAASLHRAARLNTPACWWSGSASRSQANVLPAPVPRRRNGAEYKADRASISKDDDVDPDGIRRMGLRAAAPSPHPASTRRLRDNFGYTVRDGVTFQTSSPTTATFTRHSSANAIDQAPR